MARKRHLELQQEAVELRFGQRVGALHLERVLRREHAERLLEHVRGAGDRDRALLHRLEQRALRLGRRAVDLVRQHDVREHRSRLKRERLATALVLGDHGRAHDVRRHEVGRELNARELEVHRLRQRAHEHGLAEAGHAFEQRVTPGDEASERAFDDGLLAYDDLRDLFLHAAQLRRGSFDPFDGGGLGHGLFHGLSLCISRGRIS
jgi:hypothetical protein